MEIIFNIIIFYVIFRIVKRAFAGKKRGVRPKKSAGRFKGSQANRHLDYSERYQQPRGKPAMWYSAHQHVKVQRYNITCGLVYVGEVLLDTNGYENDACLINPKLKVSPASPWNGAEKMNYWSRYDYMSSICRGAYLKWLEDGRSEPKADIGCVFLFFYGLERRLFIDGQRGTVSATERAEIIQEVNRLLKIYDWNRSFCGYAKNLLAMEWVLYKSDQPVPDYFDFNDRYCTEPFKVILAQYVSAGKPLPADVVLQWVVLHPDFGRRSPARRCIKEFKELFSLR